MINCQTKPEKSRLGHSSKTANSQLALIFHHTSDSNALVTRHKVNGGKLGLGVPISAKALAEIVRDAQSPWQRKPVRQIIPEHVLFDDDSLLVWFLPAATQTLWFKCDGNHSIRVHCPSLIFAASKKVKNLSIFATASNQRPTANTRLYLPPFMNLSQSGSFCLGSAYLPKVIEVSAIEAMQKCLLDANFSHLNHTCADAPIAFQSDRDNLKFWRDKAGSGKRVYVRDMIYLDRFATILKRL